MTQTHDLLIEIGTEELPPKALKGLRDAFAEAVAGGLGEAGIGASKVQAFAAPRRLALLCRDVAARQPDQSMERRGPALAAANTAVLKPSVQTPLSALNLAEILAEIFPAGVVNIVSFDGKPAAIPDYEIESVRLLVASELQYDPCPMIREGMMVSVTHGPLRGVVGRLMRKDVHRARLVLSVDLIGQAVSVEVDAADVKPY